MIRRPFASALTSRVRGSPSISTRFSAHTFLRDHSSLDFALGLAFGLCSEIRGISISVNYQKLISVMKIPKISIPPVDGFLGAIGGGSVWSVLDLVWDFSQPSVDPDSMDITAFCTPNALRSFLRMPQGADGTVVLRLCNAHFHRRPAQYPHTHLMRSASTATRCRIWTPWRRVSPASVCTGSGCLPQGPYQRHHCQFIGPHYLCGQCAPERRQSSHF